jgi:hypothetical protein
MALEIKEMEWGSKIGRFLWEVWFLSVGLCQVGGTNCSTGRLEFELLETRVQSRKHNNRSQITDHMSQG